MAVQELNNYISVLNDKHSSVTAKLNAITSVEMICCLPECTQSSYELAWICLMNFFKATLPEQSPLLHGQCITTLTAIAISKSKSNTKFLQDHIDWLVELHEQNYSQKSVYFRAAVVNCIIELETCFPRTVCKSMDSVFSFALSDTSIARQQYTRLLCLLVTHLALEPQFDNSVQLHLAGQDRKGNDDLMIIDFIQIASFIISDMKEFLLEANCIMLLQLLSNPRVDEIVHLLAPVISMHAQRYSALETYVYIKAQDIIRAESDARYDDILNWIKVWSTSTSFQYQKCILYHYLCNCENDCLRKKLQESLPHTKGTDLVTSFSKNFVLWDFLVSCESASQSVLYAVMNALHYQAVQQKSTKEVHLFSKLIYKILNNERLSKYHSLASSLLERTVVKELSYTHCFLHIVHSLPKSLELSILANTVTVLSGSVIPDNKLQYAIDIFIEYLDLEEHNLKRPEVILSCLMNWIYITDKLSWDIAHKLLYLLHKFIICCNYYSHLQELQEILDRISELNTDLDVSNRICMLSNLMLNFSQNKLIEVFVSARSNNVATKLNQSETSLIVRKMRKSPLVVRSVSPSVTPSYNKLYSDCTTYLSDIHAQKLQPLCLHFLLKRQHHLDIDNQTLQAVAIFFDVPEKIGRIEPALIGHLPHGSERNVSVQICLYDVHPITIHVRAEFSVNNQLMTCTLNPINLEFMDFLLPLPAPKDDYSRFSVALGETLEELDDVMVSSTEVYLTKEEIHNVLRDRFSSLIATTLEHNDVVAVFIPPLNHLILSFVPVEECVKVKIITDKLSSLLYVQSLVKNLSTMDQIT